MWEIRSVSIRDILLTGEIRTFTPEDEKRRYIFVKRDVSSAVLTKEPINTPHVSEPPQVLLITLSHTQK